MWWRTGVRSEDGVDHGAEVLPKMGALAPTRRNSFLPFSEAMIVPHTTAKSCAVICIFILIFIAFYKETKDTSVGDKDNDNVDNIANNDNDIDIVNDNGNDNDIVDHNDQRQR